VSFERTYQRFTLTEGTDGNFASQLVSKTRPAMSDFPEVPPVTPYLTVSDAEAAIRFYQHAFASREVSRVKAQDGKRLMHAALVLNGGMVMLSDDFPEFNEGRRKAPVPDGETGVTIHLHVTDVDALMARAVAAGAKVLMLPADMFWGERFGKLRDPFGHEWSLGGPAKGE
jgi:PhnB protein